MEVKKMNLIFYECKKVTTKKFFRLSLILCFIANLFLLYYAQSTEEHNYKFIYAQQYNQMLAEYSQYSLEEAEQTLHDNLLVYEIKNVFRNLSFATNEETAERMNEQLEEYKKNYAVQYRQAEKILAQNDIEDTYKIEFLYDILQQIRYIQSYPDFINQMYSRAESQTQSGIFADENSFSYKNLFKTAEDYAKLKNIHLSIGNSSAVEKTTEYQFTDFFIIALVFMVCIYLFYMEKEQKLYYLVRSAKNGRLATIFAKTVVLLLLSALISAVFFISNFLFNGLFYGFDNFSRSIQSVASFRNCTSAVTQWQFIILFVLGKILAVSIISCGLIFIFTTVANTGIMYLCSFGTLAVEYILYVVIDANSVFSNIKYINIFYIFDAKNFVGNYLNLNIFSNAVNSALFTAVVFLLIAMVCLLLSFCLFCRYHQQTKDSRLLVLFTRIRNKFSKVRGSTSIFVGEVFKYFVQNKMIIVFLILIGFGAVSSQGTMQYSYTEDSDMFYRVYMEYLKGEMTKEKEDYIRHQQEYLDNMKQKMSNSAINSVGVNNFFKVKEMAFERVKNQYARLTKLKQQGIAVKFIDENIYTSFLSNPVREWKYFIILSAMIILSLPYIFTVEYKGMMINIITATRNGKGKLFLHKMTVLFLSVLFSFITVYVPYFLRFIRTYGTESFSTPAICVNENFSLHTIKACVIMSMICYLTMTILFAMVIAFLSVSLKNNLITMILSSILLLIPCFAVYVMSDFCIGHSVQTNFINGIIISVIVLIISGLLATAVLTVFTHTKIRGTHHVKSENRTYQ